jgi:hypothetical protein
VKRYSERKRERFFSAEELGCLGKALAEAEKAQTEKPGAIAAIRLLACLPRFVERELREFLTCGVGVYLW